MNNNMDVMDRVNQFVEANVDKMAANIELEKQVQWAKVMKQFADMKGTKFHAFVLNVEDDNGVERPMVYMTNAMISDVSSINVETLRDHIKSDDKKQELSEEDGLIELTGSVLKDEISMIGGEFTDHENIPLVYPSSFSKSGKNNVVNYNDGASYTLPNRTQAVLSLKSVMKLMLMMTQTPVAKEFRDFVLDQLAIGGVAQETADEYFEAIFDKENVRLYANNTEKLLELLDKSFKYDLMKGIVKQDVDPMKQKVRMINALKKDFENDIKTYQAKVNEMKAIDEDLYFEEINTLETKIEETKRVIQGLDTVYKTLLLRLNVISKVVKKLSSESKSAAAYVSDLEVKVKEINKKYMSNTKLSPARITKFYP